MSDQETAVLTATADEWNVAMCSNDAERIGDFMADDWVIVSESGVSTKAEFLGFVASGDLTHSAMDRVGRARVRFFGDVALSPRGSPILRTTTEGSTTPRSGPPTCSPGETVVGAAC